MCLICNPVNDFYCSSACAKRKAGLIVQNRQFVL